MVKGAHDPLDDLAFLTGRWRVEGQTFPAAYGAAGRFGGDVKAEYGPQKAWIRLEQTAHLGPPGSYAVEVLLFYDTSRQELRAFSVNSYGTGEAYAVVLSPQGDVVCTTLPTAPDESVQRVTYTSLADDQVRFFVESSTDGGATFHPFSEATWTRANSG